MILLRGSDKLANLASPSVATIGNFDGFHLGHQEICQFVIKKAKLQQLNSILISFEPTPKEFFSKQNAPTRIYPLRKKVETAQQLGFDYFVCLNFNRTLAELPAVDFVKLILHDALKIKALVVGDDFKFGHKREGHIDLLREMGATLGFEVTDKLTIVHQHDRVSSTLIRQALSDSNFELAATLMGRPFTICGRVFHGDKKGRTIGFPTANIALRRYNTPISGVFAVTASNTNNTWQGVANIGSRPTVNGQRKQLEVHLFNCGDNLYSQRLTVEFIYKLRDEVKFTNFEQLKQQISIDVGNAEKYFSQRT